MHCPIHFTLSDRKGDWRRPTHPPQRESRVPDYLFMYSIQSVLGLSKVRLTLHTLLRNGPDKNDNKNGNEHVGMQKRC